MTFLDRLARLIERYRSDVALPTERLSLLRWQIAQGHALEDRATLPGHVTTSAIIVSPDHGQVLLIDHITIGRWLQPGGHYEPADHFHVSAAREAVEETGLSRLQLLWGGDQLVPLDIDVHEIPARYDEQGNLIEEAHEHHDIRFLFVAVDESPVVASDESHAAQWFDRAELAEKIEEESIRRMLHKAAEWLH